MCNVSKERELQVVVSEENHLQRYTHGNHYCVFILVGADKVADISICKEEESGKSGTPERTLQN